MPITVKNTTSDKTKVTLFGELQDGTFEAKIMAEADVPYTRVWDNEIEQRMIYIEPDPEQLKAILAALNERRLSIEALTEFGSVEGGTSDIPV